MQNTKHYRPLLLTCRYWHRLIMNTSACWSTLEDLPRPGYFYSLPLFVNYVGRCAEGPLCIVVPAPSTSEMCELCRDPNISARVKQIVLTGNWSGSNQECCNDILFSSYPSLDTFALYQHRVGDNSIPRIRRILPDSSRLRQLWLSDVDFIPTTAFPALEAFSINSLHIDPGFERSLWILLCSSPRLKAIELRIIMKLADGSILAQCSQTKVSFNALRALTLELRPKSWDGASTMPLLRCEGLVTLPHLFNITVIAHTVHLMAYESPRVFERVLCFELVT
ncbi:hypothetical protein C8Q70DRAFT_209205 [Cubamyces menziesii]|nr:hypothetical protein C8Q70DRAFT_209205 [Cubamyces menziesii]